MNKPVVGKKPSTQQRIATKARRLLVNDRSIKGDAQNKEEAILTLQYILNDIYQISVAEFDALFDTMWCHQHSLDYIVDKVASFADGPILRECAYNKKNIVIRMCYPEYFKEHYQPPTDFDLFFMKDSRMKSDLVLNSSLDNVVKLDGSLDSSKKKTKAYNNGTDIDKWLYKAFNNTWNTLFKATTVEMFAALAGYKKNFLGSSAKCLDVVMKRGIYPSPLDWYMWNSPEEFQVEHFNEYMMIRKEAGLPSIEYLEEIAQAFENVKNYNQNYER